MLGSPYLPKKAGASRSDKATLAAPLLPDSPPGALRDNAEIVRLSTGDLDAPTSTAEGGGAVRPSPSSFSSYPRAAFKVWDLYCATFVGLGFFIRDLIPVLEEHNQAPSLSLQIRLLSTVVASVSAALVILCYLLKRYLGFDKAAEHFKILFSSALIFDFMRHFTSYEQSKGHNTGIFVAMGVTMLFMEAVGQKLLIPKYTADQDKWTLNPVQIYRDANCTADRLDEWHYAKLPYLLKALDAFLMFSMLSAAIGSLIACIEREVNGKTVDHHIVSQVVATISGVAAVGAGWSMHDYPGLSHRLLVFFETLASMAKSYMTLSGLTAWLLYVSVDSAHHATAGKALIVPFVLLSILNGLSTGSATKLDFEKNKDANDAIAKVAERAIEVTSRAIQFFRDRCCAPCLSPGPDENSALRTVGVVIS